MHYVYIMTHACWLCGVESLRHGRAAAHWAVSTLYAMLVYGLRANGLTLYGLANKSANKLTINTANGWAVCSWHQRHFVPQAACQLQYMPQSADYSVLCCEA